jgi:antitoxin ParD1/3/4
MTINVSISQELETFVKKEVENGNYASVDDVVTKSLEKLRTEEETKLELLKKDIQIGLDEIKNGQTVSASSVYAQIRTHHESRVK